MAYLKFEMIFIDGIVSGIAEHFNGPIRSMDILWYVHNDQSAVWKDGTYSLIATAISGTILSGGSRITQKGALNPDVGFYQKNPENDRNWTKAPLMPFGSATDSVFAGWTKLTLFLVLV